MPELKILPMRSLGYGFVPPEYLPEGKDEYYLRNEQVGKAPGGKGSAAKPTELNRTRIDTHTNRLPRDMNHLNYRTANFHSPTHAADRHGIPLSRHFPISFSHEPIHVETSSILT